MAARGFGARMVGGGWWGDEDVDFQAMGKSLEWDLCGLASAVGGELVGMVFFFSRLSIFKLTQ